MAYDSALRAAPSGGFRTGGTVLVAAILAPIALALALVPPGARAPGLTHGLAEQLPQTPEAAAPDMPRLARMAAGDLYEWVIQEVNRFKTAHAIDIPQISRETPCEVGFLPRFPYRAASFAVRGSAYYQDLGQFLA
ncbi:MAG: hypothetical protein ACK5U4_00360, partial [Rhodospirillales bacterium]